MNTTDPFGNPLALADPASEPAVADFVEGFLACEARVANILAAAERDDSPLVQAYAAMLHLFAESPEGVAGARPHLARARAALGGAAGAGGVTHAGGVTRAAGPTGAIGSSHAATRDPATARAACFVDALEAWADGRTRDAIALHEAQAREFPRDLVSAKLGQIHAFNLGDSDTMLALALQVRDAAADIPWMHGMAAFGFEQSHRLREAEDAARHGLRMLAREPWAQHALAHVMLAEDRIDEGADFMQAASAGWTGLNSFMQTHNWWHLALFRIAQGRVDEALALHDREVWGVCKTYSQDQIGAVSLLARIELAGGDVGDRWQDVADYLVPRIHEHVLPFLDLQYLYGLARAGRAEADEMLASIEAFAPGAPEDARRAWCEVGVPAAHGLLAHARGRYAEAAGALATALGELQSIGGSHAQRDLFLRIHEDAARRSSRG